MARQPGVGAGGGIGRWVAQQTRSLVAQVRSWVRQAREFLAWLRSLR